jgi:hypothetical protein
MGLESYIISASFKKPLDQTEIINLFKDSGATFLFDKSNTEPLDSFRHWYFEIRSNLGLTEIEIMLTPDKTYATTFTTRFSILSPSTVIDQTFDFLSKLKTKRSLTVFDTDNKSKVLNLDVADFKLNVENVRKRQIIINNKTGLVIEGGSATTEYIHKNNLMDKIWGQS